MITSLPADRMTNLPQPAAQTAETQAKRALAKEFEAMFLSEMLKHSGLHKTSSSFGGGVGEDAFSSMLTNEYANNLARTGGIGIAEHIFRALTAGDPS